MARIKTNEFSDFLNPLTGEQLQTLIKEAQSALEIYEKENSLARKKDQAVILRNQLKIGNTAWVKIRREIFTGQVMGINPETIKIVGSNKESKMFKIMQLIEEKTAKKLIAENEATLAEIKTKKGSANSSEENTESNGKE